MGIGLILQCMSWFVIFWTFTVVSEIRQVFFCLMQSYWQILVLFHGEHEQEMSKTFHQTLHKMFILWYNFKWHKLLWWCSTLVHSYSDQSFPGYCLFIYDTDNIKKASGYVFKWRCVVSETSALLLKMINFWQTALQTGRITPGGKYTGLSPALCHEISPKHLPLWPPSWTDRKLNVCFIEMLSPLHSFVFNIWSAVWMFGGFFHDH